MGINMGSIMKKLDAYLESSAGERRKQKILDDIAFGIRVGSGGSHSVKDAADVFVDILYDAISTSGLDREVLDENAGIQISEPEKLSDGRYFIIVTIPPKFRETMSTKKSYYPVDLVELYNDGVDHVMQQLFETDKHGVLKMSRPVINDAHYMEQAIINFMGSYAREYNVMSIERI